MIIIGIDPDVDKSGFAVWDTEAQDFMFITSKTLHEMLTFFTENKGVISVVVVEAGWLNKPNWHKLAASKSALLETGNRTGRNHQRGIDIVEVLEWFGIPCRLQKPLMPNTWKKDEAMFRKITGVSGGNQEKRDAAMLVFGLRK